MQVPVFSHPECVAHDPGADHPESPERLRVLLARLREAPFVDFRESPIADLAELLVVHDAGYLAHLAETARRGGGVLDADTVMSSASWDAARRSAGGALAAVDHALEHSATAFSAGRPPGHHALHDRAMGFCLLANAVLAAKRAASLGAQRVLIVDWDVHHGNGTQALVEREAGIRFVSMHRSPWWPGTGAADERGIGNIWNVPRPPDLPPRRYVEDFWSAVDQATTGWRPELVVVSAGFDSMAGDPLGGFTLEPEHYAELTHRLRNLPGAPPLVGLLEGGYIPSRLADGAVAHLAALT
jgi:acetoin utilization deacetylase AcuC-like enzyme